VQDPKPSKFGLPLGIFFWYHVKQVLQALLSIFKRRDHPRGGDTALETCDCELQADPERAQNRLVFRLNCRQGVVKTYRLFYESGEILHAAFDKTGSVNYWTVSSRTLRDVVEYFGPKTDQLDWYVEQGKVTFTSYTEKIQSGRGEFTCLTGCLFLTK
jgi:cell cycle checkpoint control protein RAD9A